MINAYLPFNYQRSYCSVNLKSLWAIGPAWANLRQIIPSLQTTHPLFKVNARSIKHLVGALFLFIPIISAITVIALRKFGNIDCCNYNKVISHLNNLSGKALDALKLDEEKEKAELRLWKSASGATLDKFGCSVDNFNKMQKIDAEAMQGYNLIAAGRLYAKNLRHGSDRTDERMAKLLDHAIDLQNENGAKVAQEALANIKKGEEILFYGGIPGHAMIYRIECLDDDRLELSVYNTGMGSWQNGFVTEDGLKKFQKGYHPISGTQIKKYEYFENGEIKKFTLPKVCTHLVSSGLNKKELDNFLEIVAIESKIPENFLKMPEIEKTEEQRKRLERIYKAVKNLSVLSIPQSEIHPAEFRRPQISGFCVSRSLFAVYFHLLIKEGIAASPSDRRLVDRNIKLAKNTFKVNHLKHKMTFLLAVFEKIKKEGDGHYLNKKFLKMINLKVENYWKKRKHLISNEENFKYEALFYFISEYIKKPNKKAS